MTLVWTPRERMPKHGETDGEFRYDAHIAEGHVKWFGENLRIPEGDHYGEPFALPPWQADFLRGLHGWRRKDGRRRYTRAVLAVARGNAKSALVAGIGTQHIGSYKIPSVQVLGAGTDRENAGIIYRYSESMVRQNKDLSKRLGLKPSTKHIFRKPGTGATGFYRVTSSDAKHAHGTHPSLLMRDDLQEMEREFYGVLSTSQVSVADPLTVDAMTAGFDRGMAGWEEWQHAEKVLGDPNIDPTLLVHLFTTGPKDDIEDPAVQLKANPNLGVTVSQDFLRQQIHKAKSLSSFENTLLTLHFNRWVNQRTRWLSLQAWDATAGIVDEAKFAGREVIVSVDLATVSDIAAVSYVFPAPEPEPIDVVWDFFMPADNIQDRVTRDRVPYDVFISNGWMTATDGNVVDYDRIEKRIQQRVRGWKCKVREIVFDPWQAQHFAQDMSAQGLATVEMANTCRNMNPGVNEAERLVLSKRLRHGGNQVARWMVDNTVIYQNGSGERKPDKGKSQEKIDGVTTLCMALSRAILKPDVPQRWGLVG